MAPLRKCSATAGSTAVTAGSSSGNGFLGSLRGLCRPGPSPSTQWLPDTRWAFLQWCYICMGLWRFAAFKWPACAHPCFPPKFRYLRSSPPRGFGAFLNSALDSVKFSFHRRPSFHELKALSIVIRMRQDYAPCYSRVCTLMLG